MTKTIDIREHNGERVDQVRFSDAGDGANCIEIVYEEQKLFLVNEGVEFNSTIDYKDVHNCIKAMKYAQELLENYHGGSRCTHHKT